VKTYLTNPVNTDSLGLLEKSSKSLSERLRYSYEFSCGLLDMLSGTDDLMVQIHATLDDVGNCQKDGMSAVVGYVGYKSEWNKFNWRWMMTLQQLNLPFLHTAKYLHDFYLSDGCITDDDIARILAPYIAAVRETLLVGGSVPICVITECDAYAQLTQQEKKYIRPPDEHSFEIAVMLAARALRNPLHISDSISIQMDEADNAARLYARYAAMKTENDELKSHLGALCFCDDRKHPPVQAADMLGNVVLKTWRNMDLNGNGVLPRAYRELTVVDGRIAGQMLHFDLPNLQRLAAVRKERSDRMVIPDVQ
jgi:hypothetical protein